MGERSEGKGRKGRGLGIGAKLYLYLGLSLALIAVAAHIGASALRDTRAIEERIERESHPRVRAAMQVAQRTTGLVASGRAILAHDAEGGEAAMRRLAEARRLFASALAGAEAVWPQATVFAEMDAQARALNAWVDEARDAEGHALAGLAPLERALVGASERAGVEALTHARGVRGEAARTLGEALVWFTTLNVVGFATLAISLWLFVRRVIVRRIAALSSAMRQMSGGDLEVPVKIEGKDELSEMGYALDIFREHARELKRLNRVEELSQALKEKNEALEGTLAELHRAQDQVVHQEKLAALGQLTAGVAHEIQNPLNFVKNFSIGSARLLDELDEVLGPALGESEEAREIVGETKESLSRVVEHSKRADNIVKAMLLHSRTASGQREEIEVNTLITEYAKLAYHSQRARDRTFNLTIEEALDEHAGTVHAVGQDIGRVFLNLVTNACQASAERAKAAPADYQPTLTLASARDDTHVHIRIRDNGAGIPAQVREKMFEPFFTTKPTNVGTGLGLSISNDIVRAHGGTIKVDSSEGEFTEFTVSLPHTTTQDERP